MASKSKKRRRVLGASCILAALIIAGSSFAWFTSKDEVTNRLTASSDYGVSIVESFTPPKMWQPGQEVNKDVYAVNTGNIAAYVKENVGGILNYTFESKVGTWDDKCLVLNDTTKTAIDGVTTNEAGGFLAWTSTTEALGELASGRQNEDPAVASRWTPTQTGVYIFRRSVTHDGANDNTHPTDDKFKYAGYYFVKQGDKPAGAAETATEDTYYKIVIGDDDFRTYKENGNDVFDIYADQTKLGGTATVKTDGTIEGTPKIYYVKEKTIEDTPVNFTYDENSGHPRLVVEYGAVITPDGTYDATADAARKRVEYVNAKGQYDQDTVKYEQAVADYTYAYKLAAARNALQSAAATMSDAYDAAYAAGTGTTDILAAKWDALVDQANGSGSTALATNLKTTLEGKGITGDNGVSTNSELSPDELLSATVSTNDNKTVLQILQEDQAKAEANRQLNEVQANYEHMVELWVAIQNDISDINDALDEYDGNGTMITPEEAKQYESVVDTKFKHLAKTLREYAQSYADLFADRSLASYLDYTTSSALTDGKKGEITTIANSINADNNSAVTIDNDFNDAVTEFVNAYNNNEATTDAYDTELANWNAAKTKYNTDVAAAKSEYNEVVTKTSGKPQPGWEDATTDIDYEDHSDKIVPMYSARREGQTPASGETYDPKLSTADNYLDATLYTDKDFKYYELLEEGSSPKLPPAATATTNTALVVTKPVGTMVDGVITDTDSNTTFVDIDDTAANLYKDGTPANGTSIQALKNALTNSTSAYEAAKLAYETAVATADATSKITIYVNLADDYANYWQYAGDKDQTGTTPTQKAEFYYRYLLQPGETSHKLIDSVELANTVTPTDYKNLTFDLNVTLDSAQITYADDQRTITTTAVDANNAFTLRVEDNNPESLTDQFSWVDRDAASNAIYKVNGNKVTVSDFSSAEASLADYKYSVVTANGTYVGKTKAGTYYKLNTAGDALETNGDDLTINVVES